MYFVLVDKERIGLDIRHQRLVKRKAFDKAAPEVTIGEGAEEFIVCICDKENSVGAEIIQLDQGVPDTFILADDMFFNVEIHLIYF